MKILHIGKFYPPFHGGMEHYLCDLAREQVHQGHEVLVLVHNHKWGQLTAPTTKEMMDGVQVIRQRSLRPILFAPLMLGLNSQLKDLLEQHQPDIIHLHWPNPSLFTLLLNKLAKQTPWVISWHSDMVTGNSRWMMKFIYAFIKPLESRLIKLASSLLVSTQYYADHSKQLINAADKTHVIPLGLRTHELDTFDDEQKAASLEWANQQWHDKDFRLFNLGRLTFYKNQQMLITAVPLLDSSQLLIAGDGQLKAALNQQITDLNLQEKVKLLGSQSWHHIHALFETCDVFCMASDDRAESFGVVLLEAMYHNKIILVPDTVGSGMRWLAENYNKGVVFEANNPADFAHKIQTIQQNHDTMLNQPKQFSYPISVIAEKIEQHYLAISTRRTA